MKFLLALALIATINLPAFSQNVQQADSKNQTQASSYAYVTVSGTFSKKLKVEVDLGDTPEQIKTGKEYSDTLKNKKSYAAILNYMAERQYELVATRDETFSYQGTGGSSGIVLIMRKRK